MDIPFGPLVHAIGLLVNCVMKKRNESARKQKNPAQIECDSYTPKDQAKNFYANYSVTLTPRKIRQKTFMPIIGFSLEVQQWQRDSIVFVR